MFPWSFLLSVFWMRAISARSNSENLTNGKTIAAQATMLIVCSFQCSFFLDSLASQLSRVKMIIIYRHLNKFITSSKRRLIYFTLKLLYPRNKIMKSQIEVFLLRSCCQIVTEILEKNLLEKKLVPILFLTALRSAFEHSYLLSYTPNLFLNWRFFRRFAGSSFLDKKRLLA